MTKDSYLRGLPQKANRMGVHSVNAFQDVLLEFAQGSHSDVMQEAPCHLGKDRFHLVQPGVILAYVKRRQPWFD